MKAPAANRKVLHARILGGICRECAANVKDQAQGRKSKSVPVGLSSLANAANGAAMPTMEARGGSLFGCTAALLL
jgi:hypothetical protein